MNASERPHQPSYSPSVTAHLALGLILWPVTQLFREGALLLPVIALLFACGLALRVRTPRSWRLAVHCEVCLAVILLGGAAMLSKFITEKGPSRLWNSPGELPFTLLVGVLLGFSLVSLATLLSLLRRETRARYGIFWR